MYSKELTKVISKEKVEGTNLTKTGITTGKHFFTAIGHTLTGLVRPDTLYKSLKGKEIEN